MFIAIVTFQAEPQNKASLGQIDLWLSRLVGIGAISGRISWPDDNKLVWTSRNYGHASSAELQAQWVCDEMGESPHLYTEVNYSYEIAEVA